MRNCTSVYIQVLRLEAVPCDKAAVNGQVQYFVDKPSYFTVNSSTGVVTVWNRLDASSTTEHVLQVSADRRQNVGGMHTYILYICRHSSNALIADTARSELYYWGFRYCFDSYACKSL